MPIDFEKKFRSRGLEAADESDLREAILATKDTSRLLSFLYMYGYSYKEDLEVLKICDTYICNPVPGLTAVCMKVAIDYWGRWKSYAYELAAFLDFSKYDLWYDEVIFSSSYVARNTDIQFPPYVVGRFKDLVSNPDAAKELGLQ